MGGRGACDRSGRCAVSLDHTVLDVPAATPTYPGEGAVCGRTVSEPYAMEG